MTTFVDTSALYALLASDDAHHQAAAETMAFLALGEDLVTHNYVVVECASVIQRRIGALAVRSLIDELIPLLRVVWVDSETHDRATTALLATGSRTVSLVDWTSFMVMRAAGIQHAFAFDSDFVAQGFSVVPSAQSRGAGSVDQP
jgi:predicted nucleic acid-binding protein